MNRERTYVIAEAAGCHDLHLAKALALITAAHEAGADAVKFQYCSEPAELAQRRRLAWQADLYRCLHFPFPWFQQLRQLAEAFGLDFLCTVYLPQDVTVIAPYVDGYKVASLEHSAGDLQREILQVRGQKPIFVSCGAMTEKEITRSSWQALRDAQSIFLLHCVCAYPCERRQANLRRLRHLDGLSDHTRSLISGAVAVAADAWAVEKHLRLLDTDPANPDRHVSLTPSQFGQYVAHIREAEAMLAEHSEDYLPCEEPLRLHRVVTI